MTGDFGRLYMTRSRKITKKYISVSTIVSTFAGMMMAVPFAFALSSPANNASAAQAGQTATAQVTTADFAKYAYAYNQGYDAHVASASTGSLATCSEASVLTPGSGAGGGVVASASTSEAAPMPVKRAAKPVAADHRMASMVNSYNTYTSMIHNSSSVTNTNSNNTVGSNNATTTEVKVEDSKGVMIGVSNDPSATLMATNDSFNKDSYNTKTDTTVVNDSFNKETNLAIDSGNTSTETETVNVTKTETNTVDSNNTMSHEMNMTSEVNKTENTAIDSFNTTTVDTTISPVPVDLEQQV